MYIFQLSPIYSTRNASILLKLRCEGQIASKDVRVYLDWTDFWLHNMQTVNLHLKTIFIFFTLTSQNDSENTIIRIILILTEYYAIPPHFEIVLIQKLHCPGTYWFPVYAIDYRRRIGRASLNFRVSVIWSRLICFFLFKIKTNSGLDFSLLLKYTWLLRFTTRWCYAVTFQVVESKRHFPVVVLRGQTRPTLPPVTYHPINAKTVSVSDHLSHEDAVFSCCLNEAICYPKRLYGRPSAF